MKKETLSVKSRFFLKNFFRTFLLLLLPLCITGSYSLYRFRKDSLQTIRARNQNLLYQVTTQVNSMFRTVDIISDFLLGSASVSNSLQNIFLTSMPSSQTMKQANSLAQYLQSIVRSNEFSRSCYLYYANASGRYIASSDTLSFLYSYLLRK